MRPETPSRRSSLPDRPTLPSAPQGCLVLQKCFDRALDDHLVALAEEIGGSAAELAQDACAAQGAAGPSRALVVNKLCPEGQKYRVIVSLSVCSHKSIAS